ncbi:Uncharacterized conserved protein [Phaffia rhodozyma]|uniref:Uncharacterized conserved protein n=1 Tax=Phaffia rhodozyma TaxID=264483 RepID=A0A0F7SJQ7_PHARH|nr:Uncharacterized conserved protein [Phaffia rhodozyma]
MSGRQGGKLKPLKAAKKATKELDDDDMAALERRKNEAAEMKAARDKMAKGGALGGGIKKSSGKK